MKATTIKVEGELLAALEKTKPARQTLTAYVRSLLEQALARHRMVEAAERYAEFVRETPEEGAWLAEWEQAELTQPPPKESRGKPRR
jgi:hypothetical protein